jgi:hypothetical protein
MARFFPVLTFGFLVNAVSGVLLLIAYPTKALTNPVFYIKLSFVAIAMADVALVRKWLLRDDTRDYGAAPVRGKILAVVSLICWIGATTAGRLLAYTYVRLTAGD